MNWFYNTTGGAGNDAQSAVYQLFATNREAVPEEWMNPDNDDEFEELCYRADLAPGVAAGRRLLKSGGVPGIRLVLEAFQLFYECAAGSG